MEWEWEWDFVVWSTIIIVPTLIIVFSKSSSSYKYHQDHLTIAVKTMSILSAKTAAEFFKNHDFAFAERTIMQTMLVHDYNLGRICTVEMFVHKQINETLHIRRKCVDGMLHRIEKEVNSVEIKGSGSEVPRFVFLSTFNMLGNLMLSRDLVHPGSKEASEFFTALTRIMEWSGNPNISDIFSCLKRFDLQGLKKKMYHDMGKALEIASTFIKERVKDREDGGEKEKDFLDVLLEFEGSGKDEPAKLSEHQINVYILEMFLAGSETTSSSVEWTLTELLHHPEAMARVKAEISEAVGQNKKLEESDIDNLPYMQAVVKKDTQVFVNVRAVGRDPECWDDPLNFKPERFLNSKTDFKGQHYELLPFDAGRRMCVGLPLGNHMFHFLLGSNVTPKSMDMKERMYITVRKFNPLTAVPRKTFS
ncbi:unnamed protein product [Withania somnifera]